MKKILIIVLILTTIIFGIYYYLKNIESVVSVKNNDLVEKVYMATSTNKQDIVIEKNIASSSISNEPLIINKPDPSNLNVSAFGLKSDFGSGTITLPEKYTCDGDSISPTLSWVNTPVGTKELALLMSTIPIDGGIKWSWVLYGISTSTNSLLENNSITGISGVGSHGSVLGYQAPCSQGPGMKTYTVTLYALSDTPKLPTNNTQVTGDVLIEAIRNITISKASLDLNYTRR